MSLKPPPGLPSSAAEKLQTLGFSRPATLAGAHRKVFGSTKGQVRRAPRAAPTIGAGSDVAVAVWLVASDAAVTAAPTPELHPAECER